MKSQFRNVLIMVVLVDPNAEIYRVLRVDGATCIVFAKLKCFYICGLIFQ